MYLYLNKYIQLSNICFIAPIVINLLNQLNIVHRLHRRHLVSPQIPPQLQHMPEMTDAQQQERDF